MRRVFVALIGVVVLQFAFPSRAHAWWEILEQLSGPGRWKGFDVDARLFCLVDSLPPDTKKDLVSRMQGFVARMQKAETRPRIEISSQIPAEGQRSAFLTAARDEVRKWTAALDEGE